MKEKYFTIFISFSNLYAILSKILAQFNPSFFACPTGHSGGQPKK